MGEREPRPDKYVDQDGDDRLIIHPDTQEAFLNYNGTNQSFRKMGANRKQVLEHEGYEHWNSEQDDHLRARAKENNATSQGRGLGKYPRRKRRS